MVTTPTSNETVMMTALTRSRSVRMISRVRASRNGASTAAWSFCRRKRRRNPITSSFAPDTASPPQLNAPRQVLAVKLQAVDDLVDHLALGAHRQPDEIQLGADHGLDRLAVGRIMRGLEHILGIDGGLHASGQRPLERAGQRRPVGAIDQDRLADQRQIAGAGAV